jgi:hypothetical protein
MSKVSDIYDAILTELDSVLPSTSYTRFPNAYDINDNPAQFLYRGYGIRYDGQARLPFEICNRRESQTFTIILTSRWDRIETRQDSIDSPAKDLLESAKLVKDAFYATDHIGSTDIMKIDSVSTSGLESVVGENFRMLKIECTITIDYFEPVT